MGSPDAGVRGAFPRWLWQGSNAKHDLVVCHLQEWTPSFFSANTGSEHYRTTSPKESLHWDFMKYFSSCLREWTTILPIDKHMEFSQDIDISNFISSYLIRERSFIYTLYIIHYIFILKETCLVILLVKRQMKNLSYCKKRIHFQAKWACCGLIKSFWREVRVSSSCHLSPSCILDLLMLTM